MRRRGEGGHQSAPQGGPETGAQGADGKKKRTIRVPKVVDGHEVMVEVEVEEGGAAWPPRADLRLLNTDLVRVDAAEKVTGRAVYTHDVRLPGMLWARVLLCPVPAARVRVDLSEASVPGTHVAIPLTDGLRDGATRWLGQPVAAVAAETPERAEDLLRKVRLELEELPWAVTAEQALADDAPAIGGDGNVVRPRTDGDREAAEAALAASDATVDATYELPVQHHVCLETHGVVVDYRGDDEATVYASTQFTHGIAGDAAEVLGIPEAGVRVLARHMGGGFGSKFGLDVPGRIACLLAKEAQRPVHLMFDRRDEFLAAGNRSGCVQRVRGGMRADGTLTALVADVTRLGGIGPGSHPGLPYIYDVEASFAESRGVLTNTDGSRAMRAPGHPQASFAMESLLDELAAAAGVDPLEARLANLSDPVHRRQLERVAREIGWHEHVGRDRSAADGRPVGIGFGVSTWGGGGRPVCEVDVRIARDGSVTASVGSQDLGTGTRTYLEAIVAEALGLGMDDVVGRLGDSRLGMANGSGGSTTAACLAPAVRTAALAAREKLLAHLAPLLEVAPELLVCEGGRVQDRTEPERGLSWREACATLGEGGVEARGEWDPALAGSGVHGAQAAKVEVDVETGDVRVVKMVCVQNCGLPLNRLALRSQIHGGMLQALSYALFEERVLDPWLGVQLNAALEQYEVAGSMDVPELVAIVDDEDERQVVIGMGEPPVVPGQSAIANAVFDACGARVRSLPITREKVLAALGRLG